MSSVKDFTLTHNVLNERDTLSGGDTLTGTVSFVLKKQTKVKSLFVKATGDASVHWSEGSGDNERSYSAHRRYFKVKEYLFPECPTDNLLPQGIHRFKFKLRIPDGDMPSSFKGSHGKVLYILTAKMSRKWRFSCEAHQELNFVSKSIINTHQSPQAGSVEKQTGMLSKEQIQMSATVDRRVYSPGETVIAFATIRNSSSKTMKPKFSLMQEIVCYAGSAKNTSEKCICKMVAETIKEQTQETVHCPVKIPHDLSPSIHNCEILSVKYYLKVYLDIKFAFDPEIRFPLDIVPESCINHNADGAVGFGVPSSSDFSPPPPAASYSSIYGFSTLDPAQHSNMQQLPQQTFSGPSSSDFPTLSTIYQLPTAPPLVGNEEPPPSYTSLFSSDFLRGSHYK